eukprot:TRINITY_DN2671_c0_g1_i2.p1 TRINITY_DN2671_c0_g1~~TRINITY_DN2671_c0_g1_i2.p1  ORF type:complete len:284 (+),score=47.16 TRINITY_DN2671_c0_g1_i2:308-1159(+)
MSNHPVTLGADSPVVIDPAMRSLINSNLKDIEKKHNIRILYACESGSRAWGFASKDSDYDVRFIYVHAVEWYLSLKQKKADTIEYMSDDRLFDAAGWDLGKALSLYRKGNAAVVEWIASPVVYFEDDEFTPTMRAFLRDGVVDSKAAYFHYMHYAFLQRKNYLDDKTLVKRKKYLYVLRPLLCAEWIWNGNKGASPVLFTDLIDSSTCSIEVRSAVMNLIRAKTESDKECEDIPHNAILDSFISEWEIKYHHRNLPDHINSARTTASADEMDTLFLKIVTRTA